MDKDPTRLNPELMPKDRVDKLRTSASLIEAKLRAAGESGITAPFPGYETSIDPHTGVVKILGEMEYGMFSIVYDLSTDITKRTFSGVSTMYFTRLGISAATGNGRLALLFFGEDPYTDQEVTQWLWSKEEIAAGTIAHQDWMDDNNLDEFQPTPDETGTGILGVLTDMLATLN